VKLARQIAEHGHYLSIPCNARKNEAFTLMLQGLPREQLLLETDCPYLGPDRTEDNEPANVKGTVAYAAELWQTKEDVVAAQMTHNFTALFRCPP
jgi:TatD DNase family protein